MSKKQTLTELMLSQAESIKELEGAIREAMQDVNYERYLVAQKVLSEVLNNSK